MMIVFPPMVAIVLKFHQDKLLSKAAKVLSTTKE